MHSSYALLLLHFVSIECIDIFSRPRIVVFVVFVAVVVVVIRERERERERERVREADKTIGRRECEESRTASPFVIHRPRAI
jgi:heme/copper-type cytochrome/quinol oxidase subunit 2